MKAPIPKNEKQRLEVLWQYEVLDTIPEVVFDELTELAAHICEAPVALITLVDENRQWFKSKVGIDLNQTSRDISFCAHAILHEDVLVVADASKDKRFAKNPLVVSEPRIRFYAGAPLITPDGQALGTLCVLDKKPHKITPDQKRALEILSRHVMTQLELRRRSLELAKTRKDHDKVLKELEAARRKLAKIKTAPPRKKLSARKSLPIFKGLKKTKRRR
ncbi:GAF domain-containing protein [Pedosphaera parvula]|uniref:Putative GAF sensor protein n=1 Tax=Pedosphaera parvula (strain Ellin514) TaxID=320771 RepID=B9XKZ0_PEDPL|nr:GAF domain-containing protein [Pedosphaera parvula]EEF59484.1 putative GAF sensor protein [Pedosphaera parvula Ellin514]